MKLLLRPDECAEILGCKKTKFYEDFVKDSTFPKPVIVGKTKFWKFADIEEWVRNLKAIA